MGKKIFVSYKYADNDVQNLSRYENSTVRDYVTEFEKIIDSSDHIYKGEHEDEDLSELTDDVIWEKLKDKIYDSSVTVIFISPNMKENSMKDRDQWIPWEVSYSLKETSRRNENGEPVTSRTNAMIAVVLPDSYGSYSYYLEQKNCCSSFCVTHHVEILFDIIRKNKFNLKNHNTRMCSMINEDIWVGNEHGYIEAVKWYDFQSSYNIYIERACDRQNRLDEFDLCKEL